jgi:protein subunit release factor A
MVFFSNMVLTKLRKKKKMENNKTKLIIEIRSAEGGNDSKLLVEDMFGIYQKFATKECL